MPSRNELDEAAELAVELGISRSEARRPVTTGGGTDRARARREDREHRLPERAIPYDNKETR